MTERQTLTLRLTGEQNDMLAIMKDRMGVSVSNKAIIQACTEYTQDKDDLDKAHKKIEDLEKELALLKHHAKNLFVSVDYFSNLD